MLERINKPMLFQGKELSAVASWVNPLGFSMSAAFLLVWFCASRLGNSARQVQDPRDGNITFSGKAICKIPR